MLMEKAKDPKFWLRVRTEGAHKEILAWIKAQYKEYYTEQLPVLSYRARMRFYGDGDRHEYERPYFARRRFLATAALLALIYPEERHYLEEVQELLWAICDEYTWALPAHTKGNLEDDLTNVDLFNAESGFAVAEICYLLEDRLEPLVLARARKEAVERVVDNYCNRKMPWEARTHNWAAVCAGNIGGTMIYLAPRRLSEQLPRLLASLECYMTGFPEDGTCMEGVSYWHYGFGNFLWFADLLYQHDGKTDLLAWEKAEAIAGYAQRSLLKGGAVISYSDGGPSVKISRGMNHYLARRFPDSVKLLPEEYTTFERGNLIWMQCLRTLLYVDFSAEKTSFDFKDIFLPDALQAVIHRTGYSLAVKAGCNGEPHNHNDVGHFIMATDKGQIFCDLGCGCYTRQYFPKDTRYGILCNSSRGHSVPLVNGQEQLAGAEYGGTMSCDGACLTLELAGAYGQENFKKLTRRILPMEEGFCLTDSFAPDYESITERFVTLRKPVLYSDHLLVDGVKLCFDPEKVTPTVTVEEHRRHAPVNGEWNQPCYCIDFALKKGLEQVEFAFLTEA